jgi:hypothetical protein
MQKAGLALMLLFVGPSARAQPPLGPPLLKHRISVDARGPLALVEVTRELSPARGEQGGFEAILDLALPDGGVLADVEVRDGAGWRKADESTAMVPSHAADLYRSEAQLRGATPGVEPYDDSAVWRVRVARARGKGPVVLRYRFAVAAPFANGRHRLRFPPALEALPGPADVSIATRDAADVEISGVRTIPLGGGGTSTGRASTRAGWEISWAPRDPTPTSDAPGLEARVSAVAISRSETAVGYAVRSRPARATAPPAGVLVMVDRSRSVGLPGLSAERDLVRKLLEALPPTTRFDVLFFDRGTKRLFPMSRPATREAIDAFEAEMVPDRLQNGTDLVAALHDAGALLRREQAGFGPRALLVLVTDAALPDRQDGQALDRALGKTPGLELDVATFSLRPADDDPATPTARHALQGFAGARGGVAREVRANELDETVRAALVDVGRGGDLQVIRLAIDGHDRVLAESLAPGAAVAGVVTLPAPRPRSIQVEATLRAHRIAAPAQRTAVSTMWLRPWTAASTPGTPAAKARLKIAPAVVVLVEPVVRPAPATEPLVKGSMDRMVMRNVLSLAYMPRARACYLDRTAATRELRDLSGRVRLAIDVVRGEVERVNVESSSLNHAEIERCLRDGAFAIDVPRAVRSDAPVTAILNLVFRPRTPEKRTGPDLGAVGDQIDLIIEEAQRRDDGDGRPHADLPPTLLPTR